MDLQGVLSYAPHAGVVVAIVIVGQMVKATPVGARLGSYFIFAVLGLGFVLGIPVSVMIGQVAWHELIVNSFIQGAVAAFVFKMWKAIRT